MAWLPKQKVVVPVDFSDESLDALQIARENFVDDASHLYAIHVLPELSPSEPGVIWDKIDDKSRCRHAEESLRQKLGDGDYEGLNVHVVVGNPGKEITDYAAEIGAELIALPSHGRTGLSRVLLGSVAERVVRLAHCPVLVLRK